jgi:uncharacterized membrane protein YeaQ/YmgE (transglycosylase-associated protein family)
MKNHQLCLISYNPLLNSIGRLRRCSVACFAVLFCLARLGAEQPGIGEKAKEAAREASASVEKAASSAADQARNFWERIDASRLKNRTPDEVAAWIIIGSLVGAVAGALTKLKTSGLGLVGRLVLGLAGAFLGGVIVNVGRFDFGWGPVLIRYEELLFALVGAIVLVAAGKLFRSRARKDGSSQ